MICWWFGCVLLLFFSFLPKFIRNAVPFETGEHRTEEEAEAEEEEEKEGLFKTYAVRRRRKRKRRALREQKTGEPSSLHVASSRHVDRFRI